MTVSPTAILSPHGPAQSIGTCLRTRQPPHCQNQLLPPKTPPPPQDTLLLASALVSAHSLMMMMMMMMMIHVYLAQIGH